MSNSLRGLYALTFVYIGAHANFFPLWLREEGWSEPAIGWLDGLKYACVIVFPLLWGQAADRRGEAVGVLVEHTDRQLIPAALGAVLLATFLLTLRAAPEPTGPRASAEAPRWATVRALLARRDLRAIYAAGLVSRLAMHGLYGFLPLHLQDLGVPDGTVAVYWSVGVVAEILLIRNTSRLFSGHATRTLLATCFLAAVVQYGLTALLTDPTWLLPVMTLHGITFGVWYVASMEWLGARVAHEERATAQALFQTFSFGLGGTLSAVAAGYLYYQGQGSLMFGAGAAVAAVGLVLVLVGFPQTDR